MLIHLGSCTSLVYKAQKRIEVNVEDWRKGRFHELQNTWTQVRVELEAYCFDEQDLIRLRLVGPKKHAIFGNIYIIFCLLFGTL